MGSSTEFACLRFRLCGAALLFWSISAAAPRQQIARRDWLPLILMSLCGMGINQFCYVIGLQYTSPTNACIITTSTPVFTYILSVLFLHAGIRARKVGGLFIAAVGAIILIIGSQVEGGRSGNPMGMPFAWYRSWQRPVTLSFSAVYSNATIPSSSCGGCS